MPTALLVASHHNGGVVLGAFDGDELVAALFGVPGLRNGRLVHLSHLMAVHPAWRGRGIGERVKWRQRDLVKAQGIERIVWTFDPLEAVNARLNLSRLGGRVWRYERDYYGRMDDALNRGMPSDRLVVYWDINAPWVEARESGEPALPAIDGLPVLLCSERRDDGVPRPVPRDEATGDRVLVEVPDRIQDIKRRAPDAAMAWRMAARDAFERLFAAGYAATAVVRRDDHVYYYLEQVADEDRVD